MSDMLVGCERPCVVSVGDGGLMVMGGRGDGDSRLADVQVFDRKTQTWHFGPSLPKPCWDISAVVHEDLVFVMGGEGMDRAVWCAKINDLVSHCSISVPLFSMFVADLWDKHTTHLARGRFLHVQRGPTHMHTYAYM